MEERNPFRPTRWEHDSSGMPLIWLTPTAEQLAGDKSAYVYGSRGSGKTTLLKSICWADLTNNESLKLQRGLSDFPHIGVYVRLPDHVSGSMGHFEGNPSDENTPASHSLLGFFSYFSLALELICAEKALSAVHELRISEELAVDAVHELSIVEQLVAEFPAINAFSIASPKTFSELSRAFRHMLRRMNEATGRGTVEDLLPSLPPREPYELLGTVAERLSSAVRFSGATHKRSPGFKFCLDDCEVLSRPQRLAVNTLVRKSRFPVSWVVCSVGEVMEGGDTFIREQPLTDADRRVVSLDHRGKPEFFDLCEAVASLRTYFALPASERPTVTRESIAHEFPLEQKLGSVGVNDMIGEVLRRSTSPFAKDVEAVADYLLDLAKSAASTDFRFLDARGSAPPYYQAYLLWHWTGREDSFVTTATRSDFQRLDKHFPLLKSMSVQAWLRRKMVGSFLHIAGRLGVRRLPLSGAGVITTLADGSIRDFLEIMAEIFDASVRQRSKTDDDGAALNRFASRTKISVAAQNAGINAASEAFFAGLGALTDVGSASLAKLVEGLAKYTSRLQNTLDDPSVLATTERGVFVMEDEVILWAEDPQTAFVKEVITRAELSGYLRPVPIKRRPSTRLQSRIGNPVGFRLHRRLAPKFLFSYRGAYEPVSLSAEYMVALCDTESPLSIDDWVGQLMALGSRGAGTQLTLSFQEGRDDGE